MDETTPAASSSGLRGRIAAVHALRGLRGHVIRALIPAVAVAVVAGGTAGAVTIVSLAGTEVTVDDGDGDTSGDASGTSDDASADGDGVTGTDDAATSGTGSVTDDTDTTDDATAPSSSSAEEGDPDGDSAEEGSADAAAAAPAELTFEEAVAEHGHPDYAHILTRRFPGAQWSLNGNDPVDGLVWNSSGPRPTKAELDALWPSVAAELAAERAAQEAAEAAAAAEREAELEARRNDPDVQALVDSFDPRTIWGPNPDYAHILTDRFPGVPWSLNANDPEDGLVWHGDGPKPTKEELDAMWAEVARERALKMDPDDLAYFAERAAENEAAAEPTDDTAEDTAGDTADDTTGDGDPSTDTDTGTVDEAAEDEEITDAGSDPTDVATEDDGTAETPEDGTDGTTGDGDTDPDSTDEDDADTDDADTGDGGADDDGDEGSEDDEGAED